jgi:pimeloyl-ACP methyl ester carboxylesterase
MNSSMCAVQGAARLAEGLLDALGVEKAVVVGHSAGKPSSCPCLLELWH